MRRKMEYKLTYAILAFVKFEFASVDLIGLVLKSLEITSFHLMTDFATPTEGRQMECHCYMSHIYCFGVGYRVQPSLSLCPFKQKFSFHNRIIRQLGFLLQS
jgi:hypothetical protein